MKNIIKISLISLLVMAVAPLNAALAQSTTQDVSIPVSTVIRGGVGSRHSLFEEEIENGSYDVSIVSHNQSSVHPGNDIIVQSGANQLILENVEGKADADKVTTGTIEVNNEQISVSLIMGEDKVFSGGFEMAFSKVPKETPEATTPEPRVLPKTGPASTLLLTSLVGVSSYGVHAVASKRRK